MPLVREPPSAHREGDWTAIDPHSARPITAVRLTLRLRVHRRHLRSHIHDHFEGAAATWEAGCVPMLMLAIPTRSFLADEYLVVALQTKGAIGWRTIGQAELSLAPVVRATPVDAEVHLELPVLLHGQTAGALQVRASFTPLDAPSHSKIFRRCRCVEERGAAVAGRREYARLAA